MAAFNDFVAKRGHFSVQSWKCVPAKSSVWLGYSAPGVPKPPRSFSASNRPTAGAPPSKANRKRCAHRIRHRASGIGFCPEDRKTDGIIAAASVRENIVLALQAQRGWLRPIARKEQNAIAERFIRQLGIRTPSAEQPIEFLSGGNQQKCCSHAGC